MLGFHILPHCVLSLSFAAFPQASRTPWNHIASVG